MTKIVARGWQWIYYVHALTCPIVFIIWLFAYSDFPEQHPCVSRVEVEKIHRGKTNAHIELHDFIPYAVGDFKNPIIWVVWLNAFADIVSGIFLLTYLPTYVTAVLKYDVKTAGFYMFRINFLGETLKEGKRKNLRHIDLFSKAMCAILYGEENLQETILSIICGRRLSISERSKMILFNSIAMCLPAIFFILVGLIPDEYPFLAVILAKIQCIKYLTLFISPALVTILSAMKAPKNNGTTSS
uniref:Uncharacterized protein n=1 Tax=Ditylenchus dipsaci TaxID=166011 RepID=A0A915E6I7_9BILA